MHLCLVSAKPLNRDRGGEMGRTQELWKKTLTYKELVLGKESLLF